MIIIYLLAIFSLAFFFKESDGPFGIMNKIRSLLMNNKYVGVFFYKLLSCNFCIGCWAGGAVYGLYYFNLILPLWFLAGGSLYLGGSILLQYLNKIYEKD